MERDSSQNSIYNFFCWSGECYVRINFVLPSYVPYSYKFKLCDKINCGNECFKLLASLHLSKFDAATENQFATKF